MHPASAVMQTTPRNCTPPHAPYLLLPGWRAAASQEQARHSRCSSSRRSPTSPVHTHTPSRHCVSATGWAGKGLLLHINSPARVLCSASERGPSPTRRDDTNTDTPTNTHSTPTGRPQGPHTHQPPAHPPSSSSSPLAPFCRPPPNPPSHTHRCHSTEGHSVLLTVSDTLLTAPFTLTPTPTPQPAPKWAARGRT